MKYCTKCGTQLNDDAIVCPNCGDGIQRDNIQQNSGETTYGHQVTYNYNQQSAYQQTVMSGVDNQKTNGFCIAGMVCGIVGMFISFWFIVPLVALVLSCVGLKQINETGMKGHGMAVAGIVLGIVGVAFAVISIIACASFATFF